MPTAAAPKIAPALPLKLCAVRSRLPELPIDYKLAVRQEDPHYGNAGVLESELGIFVPLLVEAGVTSFHVTWPTIPAWRILSRPPIIPILRGRVAS